MTVQDAHRKLIAHIGGRIVPSDELHRWARAHGWSSGQIRRDLATLRAAGRLIRVKLEAGFVSAQGPTAPGGARYGWGLP